MAPNFVGFFGIWKNFIDTQHPPKIITLMKSLKLIENRKIFGIQDWNFVKLCAKQLNDWYFVTKIVLTYCEKKIALVIEKKI